MSKFIIETGEFSVELPNELKDFTADQQQVIESVKNQLEAADLKNYGEIGLPKPR